MKFYKDTYFVILIIVIILIIYILISSETIREEVFSWMLKTPIESIAVFKDQNLQGNITFTEDLQAKDTIIDVDLHSQSINGKHGLIIYVLGNDNLNVNISEEENNLGEHFNPYNKIHGDINSGHVGDLGNIEFKDGVAKHLFRVKKIKLRGYNSVVGRGIAIHENEDDIGNGGNTESKKNGNVGNILYFSIIGYSKF